jgi:Carboxypeptidase regulatory-like domain
MLAPLETLVGYSSGMRAAGLLIALILQAAAGAAPQGASISGKLTDKASGQPLPRMVVTLFDKDHSAIAESVTSDEGRFLFDGVPAGKYAVLAAHDEHRSTYLRQWFGDSEPAERFGGPASLPIVVAPGESRADVDLALMRALAIEGQVLDPFDQPMDTVNVDATILSAAGDRSVPAGAFTDDRGRYRIFGLRPGRYRVCALPESSISSRASARGPGGASLARTCYPSGAGTDVVASTSDVSGIDIHVQRVGSRSVAGMVTDSRGAAADGAAVTAFPDDPFLMSASATTSNGAFTLTGLLPGRYTLRAAAGERRPGERDPRVPAPESGFASVDVRDVDAGGVAIAMTKTTSVRGRITFEGSAVPRSGQSRIVVVAAPFNRRAQIFDRPSTAPVGDDRTFELTDISPLPVVIRAEWVPDGWVLKAVRYGGSDITYTPVDFTRRAATENLDVVLTNRVARPSVRVIDEKGAPLAEYHVVTLPADPARWVFGPSLTAGKPDADGARPLDPLLPGDYLIAALSLTDWVAVSRGTASPESLASVATRVTFAAGETRVVELKIVKVPETP